AGSRGDPRVGLRAEQALLRESPLPARLRPDYGAHPRGSGVPAVGQAGLLGLPKRAGPRRPRRLRRRSPRGGGGLPRGGHRGGRARQRRSRASHRIPPDLLRGLRSRPGRQQHRGGPLRL
ncbi:MAG: Lactoylglutathione lyase and related lyases, partial [uncultured Rubrobacteraceae bacterium]